MSAAFPQTVIAIMWDFDKTLSPNYMQEPLFRKFGVDADAFWFEADNTFWDYEGSAIHVSKDAIILNQILRYADTGRFKNLDNALLKKLGQEIAFYNGLPEFFKVAKDFVESEPKYMPFQLSLEHYIVSTGLRQMILGSRIAPYAVDVWGCEFIEKTTVTGVCIGEVAYFLDHTAKTRAIFEINKGSNKHSIAVNANIKFKDRRVPFENMIYVADGPSDIPAFSIINRFKGRTYAVYSAGSIAEFKQAKQLLMIDEYKESEKQIIRKTPRLTCGFSPPLRRSPTA